MNENEKRAYVMERCMMKEPELRPHQKELCRVDVPLKFSKRQIKPLIHLGSLPNGSGWKLLGCYWSDGKHWQPSERGAWARLCIYREEASA